MLDIALIVVGVLIAIMAIVSGVTSIWLFVKYVRFNRIQNSAGLTAEETARKILDINGLQDIKVKSSGSIIFGNSYSHYFKKVRIRRFTRHKQSLTALGMGAQKACLAVLDKEGDPEMKKRVKLYPLIAFGPFAFIPMVIIGAVIDLFIYNTNGIAVIVLGGIALLFYAYSLVLSILTLKTEMRAQEKAYEILQANNMATNEELECLKELFKLYNIQYVNDIILAVLELIYYVLQIVGYFSGGSSVSDN